MRKFILPLSVVLVVVALAVEVSRRVTAPATVPSPISSPASPSSSAAVPLPPQATRSSGEAALPPATEGLACIQAALGGVSTIAGVTSLRILASSVPTTTTKPGPVNNEREIGWVFPNRYKRRDVGTAKPGLAPLISVNGFNGTALLSYPQSPDEMREGSMRTARRGFVIQVLTRLPRELDGVGLSQRGARNGQPDQLAIEARDAQGLVATLLADPRTCMPMAVEYAVGTEQRRIELSEFRRFGGILFPTVLRMSKNALPWTEERVSDVRVNTAIEDAFFRQ